MAKRTGGKFQKINKYIDIQPVLKLPNFNNEFIVTIDASADGLGGILTQRTDNNKHVICYTSRITNKYERNYNSHELEGLRLLHALKQWRCYLIGKKFKVYTDNNVLVYIQKNKNTNLIYFIKECL